LISFTWAVVQPALTVTPCFTLSLITQEKLPHFIAAIKYMIKMFTAV